MDTDSATDGRVLAGALHGLALLVPDRGSADLLVSRLAALRT